MQAPLHPESRLIRPFLEFFQLTTGVAAHAFARIGVLRFPATQRVFHKQVLFTGIQALLPVTIAGLAVGIGLVSQMRSLLGSGVELNVKMMQVVVLREFAPLLTAFIVLGRSGSAMATEIAAMKVRGEIRSLYRLGIDPGDYLIVPRVVGCCIAVPALTLLFQLVATGVGPAFASLFVEMRLLPYYSALFQQIALSDILIGLSKNVSFGLIIASVACSTGIHVPAQPAWIPQAAELSVLRSFILLLLADLLFASIYLIRS
ncbi:MlaE family ABC transporter permease [Haloferula rosea]|uniref:ABC transporter permease n=1 Tax=Haloferula rosea TaxID=490093 RepID=A0A934VDP6_9BACT|nr:ABC transporter permease [Haloferula rosea]MBK1826489.1 ABC transporter permease [Haloferula rosea]